MSITLGIPEGALAVLRNTMAEEALVSEKITRHPRPDLRLKRRAVVLCAALSLLPAACVSPDNDRFAPFTVTLGTTRGADDMLGYKNREAHALLEAASATADPGSLDAIYAALAVIFQADPPVTYLYPRVATAVVHRRIRGLASPFRANVSEYLHELWIEERN